MAIVVVFAGVFGAIIGSFLTVVAHRVPARESIVSPGSACPPCGHELRWRENVPIVLLAGPARALRQLRRARSRRAIPLLERATAVAFARSWRRTGWTRPGAGAAAGGGADRGRGDRPRAARSCPTRSCSWPPSTRCPAVGGGGPGELPEAADRRRGRVRGLPADGPGLSGRDGHGRREAGGRDGPLPGPVGACPRCSWPS